MMEHADVREALEIAAVEPGGLDRLAAGDTTEAALVAGHLAGCADCMDELTRLRRADMLLRPALAGAAPPELRARTLAYVRSVGRERRPAADALPPVPSAPTRPVAPAPGDSIAETVGSPRPSGHSAAVVPPGRPPSRRPSSSALPQGSSGPARERPRIRAMRPWRSAR